MVSVVVPSRDVSAWTLVYIIDTNDNARMAVNDARRSGCAALISYVPTGSSFVWHGRNHLTQ